MEIKCIPTKELFTNYTNGYRVVSCMPIGHYIDLTLNRYNNFTLSGSNISNLKVGEQATLNIELDPKSKYEGSYILTGYTGVKVEDGNIVVDRRFEHEILSRLMEESQVGYVLKAYPDFVQMVLNGEEDKISYKNIFNVGPKRLPEYINKVKEDGDNILFYPVAMEAGISSTEDIKTVRKVFANPDAFKQELDVNPYRVYFDLLRFPFEKSDALVLKSHPELRDSQVRCEYGCLAILHENESLGDTRLEANIMAHEAKKIIPEAYHYMVQAVTESKLIHYDPVTKYASIEATYQDELTIAKAIKSRLEGKVPWFEPMDWEKYEVVDGFESTTEQTEILKNIARGDRVGLLTGGAGCVDADTEFFTGYGWKRIADYQEGDKVLQYNQDGTAELVEPWRYIKEPCNKMYHFETKYGLNQTVSEDHNIVYWSKRGVFNECKIEDIIKSQALNGWANNFKTAFAYGGAGINLSDEEIRVMCAVICDGSFDNRQSSIDNNNTYCLFSVKKDRKKKRIRELLSSAKIPWKEHECISESKKDYTNFMFYAPVRAKVFPRNWYNATKHQLRIIAEEVVYWDGNMRNTKNGYTTHTFTSTVKDNIDFVQFAYASNGIRTSIQVNKKPIVTTQKGKKYSYDKPRYILNVCHNNMVGLSCGKNKTPIQKVVPSDGFEYCFTVPSHMLVLRREDCIFVTGNCGKTSSAKALIRMLEGNNYSYTLLAPTGVAARRLRESTGRPASTIHMFLATESIPGDYVIIDECSMLSVNLFAELIRAIGNEPNIIMVCDEAQLASIACGNVVQDIIDSGVVPRANLTKVFRYGTNGLATIATDARFGTMENLHNRYDDFTFVPISSDPIGQVLEEYDKLLKKGYAKDDILILSPFNKGNKGTYEINRAIQSRYNEHDYCEASYERKGLGKVQFKVGDRILNTHNNYHMPSVEFEEDGTEVVGEIQVMNGDLGICRECRRGEKGPILVVEFDNGLAAVSGADLANLLLGYSVSIHKVQGAQSKAIIVVIDRDHMSLLSRNLEYVSFSRAQKEMVIIADEDVLKDGLDKEENKERDTYLCEMLKEETI